MDQLKLKYVIELVSNLGAKSKEDLAILDAAHTKVRTAIGATTKEINRQGDAVKKVTGEATTATGGIIGATMRWAQGVVRVTREIERVAPAIGQIDRVGGATLQRQIGYLDRLAKGWSSVQSAAAGAARMGGAVAAGAAAGTFAVDRMTKTPMDFSTRLAGMANTAYSDRNAAGRISGKRTLEAAINAAVRTGGGTRDDAAAALDDLIASGTMPPETAIRMLPMLMRGSTASGASAQALGSIGMRSMQGFKLGIDQIPEALNMAMAAGQAGGFELKDMSRWLPQAMAAGGQSGLSGIEGFRRILGMMQASVTTAGTKDEAGNNVVNLLAKINSSDTATDFKKLGINLPERLAEARSRGVNSVDAFVGLIDGIAAKDEKYTALKAKLSQAGTTGERKETLEAMTSILQGSAVGKVVQDRQALMGLVAEMNNRGYVKSVMDRTRTDTGAIGTAFDVMSQETGFSRQQAVNEGQIAASAAFDKAAPALKSVADTGADVARQFPLLTASAVGATGALTALAAFVGGGGLLRMIMGGAAGTAGAAGGGAVAGRVAAMAGAAAPVAGVVAAGGFAGWQTWRLGSALADWYGASHRQGVTLSAQSKARLAMTAPPSSDTGGGGADPLFLQRQSLGQGVLDVRVRVDDQRVTTSSTVTTPMSLVRINPGNTNPGGYGK